MRRELNNLLAGAIKFTQAADGAGGRRGARAARPTTARPNKNAAAARADPPTTVTDRRTLDRGSQLVSDEAHMHPHAISTGEISKATIQPQLHTQPLVHTKWHWHTHWPRRALAPRVRRIRFRYVLDHGYGLLECQWLWYHGCVTAV